MDTDTTTANVTASGHSLIELLSEFTPTNPVIDPEFAWSNSLPCDECEIADSTAVVVTDDGAQRLCYHCLSEIL